MANPLTRREHQGGATSATLTAPISTIDTTFTISTNTGWPTGSVGPFFVVIDAGTGSEEKILIATQAVSVCTVASSGRGADGTVAKTHASGASVYPCWSATEADELNLHGASVSAVHGVTGNMVGTTDAQTLTNKTMSGASNAFTAIPQASITGAPAGAVVGTTDAQTLTNKTISGAANTITALPQSAVVGAPAGAFVGTTDAQTLTNKTMSGASNTFSAIPNTAVTNAVGGASLGADVSTLKTRVDTIETVTAPTVYGAGGTFAVPAGAKQLRIRVTAAGAGAGNAAATGAGQSSAGAGGGGGGYAESTIAATGLTSPLQVNVGGGGVGGSGGTPAAGGNGNASSVIDNNGAGATLVAASGGTAGAGGPTSATVGLAATAGAAGVGTTGQILLYGGDGGHGLRFGATATVSGHGGASPFGGGITQGGSVGAGTNGRGFGAGGSGGAQSAASSGAFTGGNGDSGLVVIEVIY